MTRTQVFKRLLLPLLVAITAACNPVMKGVGDGFLLASGIGQKPIEEQASNPKLGYLKVKSGPEALFVLGFREQGREAWFGAGPMTLTKENGVVLATAGIGNDLHFHQSTGAGAEYFKAGLHTLPTNQAVTLTRTRSVLGGVQQHQQQYELIAVREESVKVWAGQQLNLLRVEERPIKSASNQAQWPGAVYWVSPSTGEVVASEQWLSPGRRFALVPREGQKLLPTPVHDQPLQAVTVSQPTRLSAVLRSDARWLQQPVVAVYSQAKQLQAKRLQRGLLVDLREAEVNSRDSSQRAAIKQLHAQVQALTIAGRWSIKQLDAYWLDASPAHNPILAAGDRVVPVAKAEVTVITSNGSVCRQAFVAQQSVREYLRKCGVKKVSHGVLVAANGQTTQLALGRWNQQPTPSVGPGNVLAVPVAGMPLSVSKELAQLWWMEAAQ